MTTIGVPLERTEIQEAPKQPQQHHHHYDDEDEDVREWQTIITTTVRSVLWRCMGRIIQGSPPEPCESVQKLLTSLGVMPRDLLDVWHLFYRLAHETSTRLVVRPSEIHCDQLLTLVTVRRKWVERLLWQLLQMGGVDDWLSWDEFLYIFLRFCSLSHHELCQALFQFIVREIDSPRLHYLTWQQLAEYYTFYNRCGVKSFNTKSIEFHRLPLSRYYMSDFVELLQRFQVLFNPILHLQKALQQHIPSLNFWDHCDRAEAFTRKVTEEFFLMEKMHVDLFGEPPFRETCDMLAPDALGCQAVNVDQWNLRCPGLSQASVWGEQPSPEELEEIEREKAQAAIETELEAGAPLMGLRSAAQAVSPSFQGSPTGAAGGMTSPTSPYATTQSFGQAGRRPYSPKEQTPSARPTSPERPVAPLWLQPWASSAKPHSADQGPTDLYAEILRQAMPEKALALPQQK
mmetsp:Transcript_34684/g.80963  ORF Transcript_34684/g.80963 Transcript_34684/m.80963 type:complete len:459 (+) Transcript_34684:76-1452(+)